MLTFITTCRLNDVDPKVWLPDVFARGATSGGRHDPQRIVLRSPDMIWQARTCERPITAFRCTAAARFGDWPCHFFLVKCYCIQRERPVNGSC
jgi:hypothetical protein